jgi:hypothetical protein
VMNVAITTRIPSLTIFYVLYTVNKSIERSSLREICYLLHWLGDYIVNKIGLMLTPGWGMCLLGIPGGLAVGLPGYLVLGEGYVQQKNL